MSLYINRYNAIKKSWKFFKNSSKNKKIRIRDAAKQLNASEAELITTELSSDSIYLNIPDYEQFLKQFVKIDKLMVLVRNDYIVHEKVIKGNELLFSVNKVFNIDAPGVKSLLSIAPKIFKYAFYIKKNHAGHELRSYQLFGYNGDSILKIYLKGNDISYFEKIKDNYIVNYNFELQKQITNSKDLISLKNKIDSKSICNFLSNKNSCIKEILLMISNMKMSIEIQVLGFDIIQSHYGLINKIVDVSGAGDTVLALSSILFYLKLSQKFIGEICNLAGGMTCMESGVIAINCKELIKNAKRNNIDLYL